LSRGGQPSKVAMGKGELGHGLQRRNVIVRECNGAHDGNLQQTAVQGDWYGSE